MCFCAPWRGPFLQVSQTVEMAVNGSTTAETELKTAALQSITNKNIEVHGGLYIADDSSKSRYSTPQWTAIFENPRQLIITPLSKLSKSTDRHHETCSTTRAL